MIYTPGNIPDAWKREHYLELGSGFNWLVSKNDRISDLPDPPPLTHDTETLRLIKLEEGDIIVVKFFEHLITSEYGVKSEVYSFVIKTIHDSIETNHDLESPITMRFIQNNLLPKENEGHYRYHVERRTWLFRDVSDVWIRDKKLGDLLC